MSIELTSSIGWVIATVLFNVAGLGLEWPPLLSMLNGVFALGVIHSANALAKKGAQ